MILGSWQGPVLVGRILIYVGFELTRVMVPLIRDMQIVLMIG
jgi:hypothetical protein